MAKACDDNKLNNNNNTACIYITMENITHLINNKQVNYTNIFTIETAP